MNVTVMRDKYDEPKCRRCGHGPIVHTTAKCASYYREIGGNTEALCDCPGWERDPEWPPPIIVRQSA